MAYPDKMNGLLAAAGSGVSMAPSFVQNLNAKLSRQDPASAEAMQYLQPGVDVYAPALQGLQGLATPQGQMQAVNQYTNSPMYNQQLQSAQEATARASSATGNLRSGEAIIDQSMVPLQLQQNYLNDQTARYGQLAGLGAAPSSQAYAGTIGQAQFGAQLDQNMQMAQMQQNAQKEKGKSNFWGTLLGIGGAVLGGPIGGAIGSGIGTMLGGPQVGSGGSSSSTGPTYTTVGG